MSDKPFQVVSPTKIAWAVRFKSAEAAWRRIVRPMKHNSESEEAAKARLAKLGWMVRDIRLQEAR